MKIGKFIYSILITLIILVILIFYYNILKKQVKTNGLENLSKIILIPLLIVFFLVLYGFQISSTLTSLICIFSLNKAIKIISAILLAINIAMIIISVLLTKQTIEFNK